MKDLIDLQITLNIKVHARWHDPQPGVIGEVTFTGDVGFKMK
ncbi:hypothetical protein Nizo2814_3205 [Lactiplantibacillus plantarum]|nr:hypothetical protein Nizo2814_3205 [Lactiplantibacillus plantarum]